MSRYKTSYIVVLPLFLKEFYFQIIQRASLFENKFFESNLRLTNHVSSLAHKSCVNLLV